MDRRSAGLDPRSQTAESNPFAAAFQDQGNGTDNGTENRAGTLAMPSATKWGGISSTDLHLRPEAAHSRSGSRSEGSTRLRHSQGSVGAGRPRTASSASRHSSIYPSNLEVPDIGYLAPSDAENEKHRTLWNLGNTILRSWRQSPKELTRPGCDVDATCALAVFLEESEKINKVASYVLQHLAVPEWMLNLHSQRNSLEPASGWPRSSNRPDPDILIASVPGNEQKMRVVWPGHQVLQVFSRLQEIGNRSETKLLSEHQRLYLFQLFLLDIFSRSDISALQFDWSEDLWERLVALFNSRSQTGYGEQYQQASAFLRSVNKVTVAWDIAAEVEEWAVERIKLHVRVDREILPQGEISSRILRVWSSLHNAMQLASSWEVPVPPSENPPVSGIRRRMTKSLKRVGTLGRNAHRAGRRDPEEKGKANVFKRIFSKEGPRSLGF